MKELALSISGMELQAPDTVPTLKTTTISTIISVALNIFIALGVITALIFIIWGGFMWITSAGDKQKLSNARKTLIWAVLGLLLMVLSMVIINFFGQLLGVKYF